MLDLYINQEKRVKTKVKRLCKNDGIEVLFKITFMTIHIYQ